MSNTLPLAAFKPLQIKLGAASLSAQVAGKGRPLVLCHSLLADRTSFDLVAGALALDFQVIAVDLPGFGASTPVEGGLNSVADRVAEGIRAMDLAETPILLGNGYGGFVALLAAIRHPKLAQRLVLADCGAAFSDAGRNAFLNMAANAEKGGLQAIAEVAMRRLFAPEYQALHPELIAQRRQSFLTLDPATFQRACLALSTLDLRNELPKIDIPVLVLVGERDEATPPSMSSELAAGLPNAQLIVLEGCAHVPQLQAPEAFMNAIGKFIKAA